jgi:hypothetical protein
MLTERLSVAVVVKEVCAGDEEKKRKSETSEHREATRRDIKKATSENFPAPKDGRLIERAWRENRATHLERYTEA